MRQMDRQLLVLQYLHDNCLEESEVEIVFEPTGGLSHVFKNKTETLSITNLAADTDHVDTQITDSVTSVSLVETSNPYAGTLDETTKSEMDASKKKRPPPPKKKSQ